MSIATAVDASGTSTAHGPPSPSTSSAGSFHSTRDGEEGHASARVDERPSSLPEDNEDDDDDEELHEDSVWWTPSELRDIIERATALKVAGNAEFGHGQWELAIGSYKEGLGELPVRTKPVGGGKGKEKAADVGGEEDLSTKVDALEFGEAERESQDAAVEEDGDEEDEMKQVSELRAILFANVAACCLKLERWKDAASACDEALEENQTYIKALHRRAMANEAIGSWSSLTSAQEDWKSLHQHPLVSPALLTQARAAQTRLPPLVAQKQKKEQEEVMGKLKDLGNSVLGRFGLSTDNFKFVEQPGGGYSMNFER